MTPFSRSKKTVTEEKSEIKIPEIKTSTLNDSVLTLKKNRYRGEIRNQDIRNQDADAQ